MEPSRVYRKGESFQSFSSTAAAEGISARLADLRAGMPNGAYTRDQNAILERALSDLLEPPPEHGAGTFWLRPHVREEIERVSDQDLGRYLFHRYRYDIFPVTKELDAFPPACRLSRHRYVTSDVSFVFRPTPY